jgi:hypothetical protein
VFLDPYSLPLGKLETLTRARTAGLLPFDLTRIARQQAFGPECAPQFAIVMQQSPGKGQSNGASLTGLATPIDIHFDVKTAEHVDRSQTFLSVLLMR